MDEVAMIQYVEKKTTEELAPIMSEVIIIIKKVEP